MRFLFSSALLLICGSVQAASHGGGGWTLDGFRAPESAHFDAGSDQIFVSNIGTFGPDGGMDGAISVVSPDGEMIAADWVGNMMDPKGMASSGGKLYVADAMGLHVIDIAGGTLESTITLEGAQFPNDVTLGADGAIYVTDMFAGGVFKVTDGTAEIFVPAGSIALPNGILAQNDRLVVGSMGREFNMAQGRVEGAGALVAVDYASGEVTALDGAGETGAIDGIVELDGKILFSDNPTGEIVAYDGAALTSVAMTEPGAADIGVMGTMVLVPLMQGGKLMAMPLE